MHGQSCDVDEILQIAHEHGLITISDTAQSIGSHYKGRFTGTLTDIGGFSFNWHKHLNCGEGGMVITNNDELADRMRKLRNHGETTGTKFGHNYRMTEINAVLVEQQLPALRKRINARIKIANTLRSLIKNKDVEMPLQLDDRNHVFCSIPLLFKNKKTRDGVFDKLRINYPVKTNFSAGPLHLLDACKSFKKSMPVTEKVPDRLLDIDMNYTYSDANLKEIAKIINRAG